MTEETGSGWPECLHANVMRFRLGVGIGPDSPGTLSLIEPRWCHDCGAFKPAESEPWYQPKEIERLEALIAQQERTIAELAEKLASAVRLASTNRTETLEAERIITELRAERYLPVECPICGRLRLCYLPDGHKIWCEKCGADNEVIGMAASPHDRAVAAEQALTAAYRIINFHSPLMKGDSIASKWLEENKNIAYKS